MESKWIYWFNELRTGHNDLVGKKCANLGEMTSLGLRVPPGFAISVNGCERFMKETGVGEEIRAYVKEHQEEIGNLSNQVRAGRDIRGIIEAKPMPHAMEKELIGHYERLCESVSIDRVPVAVRSSGAVSMPGQMETYLNVVGGRELCRNVIRVWSSAFTTRAIAFRMKTGMEIDRAPIGVAVLKMVKARSAGVALTVLPTSGDKTQTIIEGNWGLGESVVSGEIMPDQFLVNKTTGEIQSNVNEKTRMVVYREAGTAMIDVPPEKKRVPCLEPKDILEISRIAKSVEDHFGQPQDMEWVIDQDLPFPEYLFWVQTRPAKYTEKKQEDTAAYLAELMTRIFKT